MLKWVLTRLFGPDPRELRWAKAMQERVQRIEIAIGEQHALLQAVWSRQRKVEGAVHGMRGAKNRWHKSADNETLDEFRERMAREGLLRSVGQPTLQGGDDNGD